MAAAMPLDTVILPLPGAMVAENYPDGVLASQHFHAAFAPIARQLLYVDTPDLLRNNFAQMPCRHRPLDVWPRVAEPRGR